MPDIFISYSRIDKEFAALLAESLTKRKYEIWIDKEMLPNTSWWEEVCKGIESSNAFVLVLSQNSLSSRSCALEVAHAISNKKRIYVLTYKTTVWSDALKTLEEYDAQAPEPPFDAILGERKLIPLAYSNWGIISLLQRIDFSEPLKFEESLEILIKAFNTDLEQVKLHTLYLTKAKQWETAHLPLEGKELKEAEEWLNSNNEKKIEVTELQREYIQTSILYREKQTSQRRLIVSAISIIFLIVVVIFALLAVDGQNRAVSANATSQANLAIAWQSAGVGYYLSGEYDFAHVALTTSIAIALTAPSTPIGEWQETLGKDCLFLSTPDYVCAENAFQQAIQHNPTSILPYIDLATVLIETTHYDEASTALDTAQALFNQTTDPDPFFADYLITRTRGKSAFAQGYWQQTLNILEPIANEDMEDRYREEVIYHLAASHQNLGHIEQACRYWAAYFGLDIVYPYAFQQSERRTNAEQFARDLNCLP